MSLAIFDLDHTLLAGDSDVLWGQWLGENGHVDSVEHERKNQQFFRDYAAGQLDIMAFLRFQLALLAEHDMETLRHWRSQYLREKIEPIMLPKAFELLGSHRRRGHTLLIITATNRFITEPIAEAFGVHHLIATEPELADGRFTGRVDGVPSFREGKVTRLRDWLQEQRIDLMESWFYSDSRNDIPLLEQVTHPVAVDPDETLAAEAQQRGWPVISLR